MSVSELASQLLLHIEEAYPDGGYLFSTPQYCKAAPPPKPIPPAKVEPKLSKILPGIDLHPITPTPILLIHQGEQAELLLRLSDALSKKRAPAQVVQAHELTHTLLRSPLIKLLVTTPKAKTALGTFQTSAKIYTMESPDTYLKDPSLRQPLWDALCALL